MNSNDETTKIPTKLKRCQFCQSWQKCQRGKKRRDSRCKAYKILRPKQVPLRLKKKIIKDIELLVLQECGHPYFDEVNAQKPKSPPNIQQKKKRVIKSSKKKVTSPPESSTHVPPSQQKYPLSTSVDLDNIESINTDGFIKNSTAKLLPLVEIFIDQSYEKIASGEIGVAYALKQMMDIQKGVIKDYQSSKKPEDTAKLLKEKLINPIQVQYLSMFIELLKTHVLNDNFRNSLGDVKKQLLDNQVMEMINNLKEQVRLIDPDVYKLSLEVAKEL